MSHEWWHKGDDGLGSTWSETRPSYIAPAQQFATPSRQFTQFTAGMDPFWGSRAPLTGLGQNLQARYMLASPMMGQRMQSPTFSNYLRDYTGDAFRRPTYRQAPVGRLSDKYYRPWDLRGRAEMASLAATEEPGQFLSRFRSPYWQDVSRQYSSTFGRDNPNAIANQMAVANMLALQRPESEGGEYTGALANAITGTLGNIYQRRANIGKRPESFLSWYLEQSKPRRQSERFRGYIADRKRRSA